MYIEKLDDIIYEYNNTYHCKIKVNKLVDVNSSTYINANEESNDKDPKFEVGDERLEK